MSHHENHAENRTTESHAANRTEPPRCRVWSSAPARSAWPPPPTCSSAASSPLVAGARPAAPQPRSATGATSGSSPAGPSSSTRPPTSSWPRTGWTAPDPATYPTGADWAALYLQPLADALGDRVRYGTTVTGVARARPRPRRRLRPRASSPSPSTCAHADGTEDRILARAVVDASGTWTTPNPLGSDGYPAAGENGRRRAASPTASPTSTAPTTPPATAAGAPRSSAPGTPPSPRSSPWPTLAETQPGTTAVWVLRRGAVGNAYGGGDADQLPARGALGARARQAVAAGHIEVVTGFRTDAVERDVTDVAGSHGRRR